VDRVVAVLTEVGQPLTDEDTYGKLVVEPPQALGVEALAESQVTIRMLAKTLPLKQRDVARELRWRIKTRFDREGLRSPCPPTASPSLAPPIPAVTDNFKRTTDN